MRNIILVCLLVVFIIFNGSAIYAQESNFIPEHQPSFDAFYETNWEWPYLCEGSGTSQLRGAKDIHMGCGWEFNTCIFNGVSLEEYDQYSFGNQFQIINPDGLE